MENTSDYFMPRPLLFCMKSEKSVCYSVPDNNGQSRRNQWIENDKKGGNDYEENNI